MAVILGFDYGSKRIGVARGTTAAKLASPLLSLPNNADLQGQITELITREGAQRLVVGLPRGLDGQETAQSQRARDFGAKLGYSTGLRVAWQDEAATSLEAAKQLGKGKKGDVDSVAASIILQDYLDNL